MSDGMPAPPGLPTRVLIRSLGLLRRAGMPLLSGLDDGELRASALGLATSLRRTVSGAPAPDPAAATRRMPDACFAALGADDRFDLLADNRAAFDVRCAAIDAARERIDCALYYLADDASGGTFAAALSRAVRRGVRVRLAVDANASYEKQYAPFAPGQHTGRGALCLLDRLRREGMQAAALGAGWSMHRKFLALDGERVLLGGRNVADHYASPGWRDLELDLAGPFARRFSAAIEETFDERMADPRPPEGVLLSGPDDRGEAFTRAACELVDEARSTVDVEHAYVLSHPWFEDAVRGAVERGVRVRVVSNSAASNDLGFMSWRLATALETLRGRGAQLYRRRGRGATLHTKLIVADARRIVFGSSNLDYFTPVFCAEADVGLESDSLGAALVGFFEAGLADETTEAVVPRTAAHDALLGELNPLSFSRLYDLLLHEMQ
jgi:cardiolipin synthase